MAAKVAAGKRQAAGKAAAGPQKKKREREGAAEAQVPGKKHAKSKNTPAPEAPEAAQNGGAPESAVGPGRTSAKAKKGSGSGSPGPSQHGAGFERQRREPGHLRKKAHGRSVAVGGAGYSDSTVLDMQAEEVLQGSAVQYDAREPKAVLSAVARLSEVLRGMPEGERVSAEGSAFATSLLHDPDAGSKVSLLFRPPAQVQLCGAFATSTAVRPHANADVAVLIPKDCFHEKDFLNYRYHAKRYLYLQQIKECVGRQDWVESVRWSYALHKDPCKPTLLVQAQGCGQHPIRIDTRIGAEVFALPKLAPARNNVRWIQGRGGQPLPTRLYNASILEDVLLCGAHDEAAHKSAASAEAEESHGGAGVDAVEARGDGPDGGGSDAEDEEGAQQGNGLQDGFVDAFIKARVASLPALGDAIVLLKVWHRQHFPQGPLAPLDAVTEAHLELLACYLASNALSFDGTPQLPRLLPGMSPVQMFRVTVDTLANGKTLDTGVRLPRVVGADTLPQDAQERWAGLTKASALVVCDPECIFNFAFRVSAPAVKELKAGAALTLKALLLPRAHWGVCGTDPITAAFLTRCPPEAKFDVHVRVDFARNLGQAQGADWHPSEVRKTASRAERVAAQALTDRAHLVRLTASSGEDDSSDPESDNLASRAVFLGVLLASPDTAFRLVDRGPSAEKKVESQAFRAFWGSKSELRRWKDGSITECAGWECPATERHLIIPRLLKHSLSRHLAVPEDCIHVSTGQLDAVLLEGEADPMSTWPRLQDAFERTASRIKQLQSLPLPVTAVHALSPALRQTAVFPPQPVKASGGLQFTESLEIALQLEGSGRWPIDPLAVAQTQLAFCLHAARCLAAEHPGVHVSASELGVDAIADGFAFRLTSMPPAPPGIASSAVQVQKALALRDGLGLGGPASSRGRDVGREILHSSMVHTVLGLHPTFSPTVRLAKRWVGAHLFSAELREQAVELIAASCFLSPLPLAPPQSRLTGFLRFLELLANHDWESTALVIDPNSDLDPPAVAAIQASYRDLRAVPRAGASKKHRPGERPLRPGPSGTEGAAVKGVPVMCLAAPHDPNGFMWTQGGPSVKALVRIQQFARSSAEALAKLLGAGPHATAAKWKSIFCTPLATTLDAALVVSRAALPHPGRLLFSAAKTFKAATVALRFQPEESPKRPHRASLQKLFTEIETRLPPESKPESQVVVDFDPTAALADFVKSTFGDSCHVWYDATGAIDALGLTLASDQGSEDRATLEEIYEACGDLVQDQVVKGSR